MIYPNTDNLKQAFHVLRCKGYVARMNFSCCASCGWYEIGQSKKGASKAVWFHRQAHTRLMETGRCHLQWAGDVSEICAVLYQHGIRVTSFPLDESNCIEIDLTDDFEQEEMERDRTAEAWNVSASLAW